MAPAPTLKEKPEDQLNSTVQSVATWRSMGPSGPVLGPQALRGPPAPLRPAREA